MSRVKTIIYGRVLLRRELGREHEHPGLAHHVRRGSSAPPNHPCALRDFAHAEVEGEQRRGLRREAARGERNAPLARPRVAGDSRSVCDRAAELGDDVQLVTPGIRPELSKADDQKRTMTPAEAIQAGANWLVIGRPITGAADPKAAAIGILHSINPELVPEGERREPIPEIVD